MFEIRTYLECVALLSAGTCTYGAVTTCQTPQDVHVGETGTIRCSFPDKVDDKQFVVYKYNLHSDTEDEATKGSEQTVSIPNVTTRHEGKYFCRLIPDDGECKPCVLKVKEEIIVDDSQKQEGNTGISGDHNMKEETDEKETSKEPLIAGVVCGVGLLIAAACVVTLVVYIKRRRKRLTKEHDGADKMMVQDGDTKT